MAFMLCTGLHDFLALAVFDPAFTVWSSNVGKLSYTIGIPPCNFSAVDRSEPEWERESSYSYLYCTGQLVLVTPSFSSYDADFLCAAPQKIEDSRSSRGKNHIGAKCEFLLNFESEPPKNSNNDFGAKIQIRAFVSFHQNWWSWTFFNFVQCAF